MSLKAVHHVAILVKDYQKSRHFYVDLLGFAVIRENYRPQRGDWKLDLAVGELELEIFSARRRGPSHRPEALGLRPSRFPGGKRGAGSSRPECHGDRHRAGADRRVFRQALYLFLRPGRPAAGTA